jgi:Toprim-like
MVRSYAVADDRPVLTLAELEAADPHAPAGGRRRRFLCPLCGDAKRRDAEHRSLSLEVATGGWRCFRCGAKGQLREHWQSAGSRRLSSRARARRAFGLDGPATLPRRYRGATETYGEQADLPKPIDPQQLGEVQPLTGTPGAAYLEGRGIPLAVAEAAGVKYSPAYFGRPAVLFPLHDRGGQSVAVNGRYLDIGTPKTRTAGPKAETLFLSASVGKLPKVDISALDSSPIVITEAPIDALSLALAGVPSLALCGTSWPAWLRVKVGFSRVALAFDADQAGDQAAEKLCAELENLGSKCERWRPEGAKDWNEALQARGMQWLRETIIERFDTEKPGPFPFPTIDICHICGALAIGYTPDAWRACAAHLDGGTPW